MSLYIESRARKESRWGLGIDLWLQRKKKKLHLRVLHTQTSQTHPYAHAHTRGLHFKAYCQGFGPKGLSSEFVSDLCKADCSIMGFLFFLLFSLWQKRSDIYQAAASKAKHASARINDPLNEAGNDLSSLRVHIWFSKHNFKLSMQTVTTPSFTKRRLCHRHPSSGLWLPECGNSTSTYILYTYSIFKCDSSNCGLWGRPCTANVILIRLPQEGDRRRHVIVPLRILSALLLFSHTGMHS